MKFFNKKFLGFILNIILITLFASIAFNTLPAWAWKPTTHVSLAEIAMEDAIKDGKVTIPYVSYRKGEIKGEIGSYEVNPNILEALKNNAPQYRAGILGPDAYPDILTGQQVIHPNESVSEKSDSNAWLEYLWRKANENGTLPVRAFVTGFLTHAAGDMFGHTFVNNFTGAPFTPIDNAVKHVILEGYVDKRSKKPRFDASIDGGVHDFIYQTLVDAKPNTDLRMLFDGSGNEVRTSIPYIFSVLRETIVNKISSFEQEKNDLLDVKKRAEECKKDILLCLGDILDPGKVITQTTAEITLKSLIIEYLKAWRDDIDSGLKEWPKVSHNVAINLFFNPDGAKVKEAMDILQEYLNKKGLSMAGAPDIIGEFATIVEKLNDLVANIVPDFIKDPIDQIKQKIYDKILVESIGMTVEQLKEKFTNPATFFDEFMTTGFGETINCVDFNKKYLKIKEDECFANPNNPTTYDFRDFPAAYNTVVMSKMILMSPKGVKDLLTDLGADTTIINEFTQPNAMLGFIASLDGDNQWLGDKTQNTPPNERKMIFARDCRIYTQLFMEQPKDIKLSRILTEEEKTKEKASLKEIYLAVYDREPTDEEISKTFDDLAKCIPIDDTFPKENTIVFVNNASDKSIKAGSRDFPFKTLTDAINAAKNDDTLLVSPGIYPEKISTNKKIRITSYVNQPVIIGGTH